MDLTRLRPVLPLAYGAVVATLWATVSTQVATTATIVGGIVLGLFYAFDT